MSNYPTTCVPERIELFLEQKLSDEEQSAFESHLSACDNCRQRLETAAAGEDISFEICESLRGDCPDFCPSKNGTVPFDAADDSAIGESASSSHATVLKLLAPTDDDRMLGRWGTYEVVGVVGAGGMGVVLKALDVALNRYVAIKILAPHLGNSGAAIKRFFREGKAAAAVVHDNVIEIYHVAEAAGLPYLVMPYVRGPSLQRRLEAEGPLAVVEILRVGMQAAAGLAAAHAQGLVHRDVKPANILLSDGIERVKLTDFGLARAADDASLTRTGVIAGTPQYMSPEQARGEPVDPRSDLFSLGSVLYAMCTGRPPFRAETSYGVLRRITDEEPRPIREINPDIPDWLCAIVAKLMAKQPDDRFQSASEVALLLEPCLAHVQQPTVVPLPDVLITLRRDADSSRRIVMSTGSRKHLLKGTLAMLTLIGISLFAVGVVSTNPPDISGNWQGEDWGQVTLTQISPGKYSGTYTDTVAREKGPGKIELKWSRIERRFNGTWREGDDDRFGDISVHLVRNEIQGALTTSASSKINPATPRLAELTWTRAEVAAGAGAKRTDLVSVTAIPALEPMTWRWKIHLPKDKRYALSAAYGKLPANGFPKRPWSTISNDQYWETGVDAILTAALRRQNDGNWALTFTSQSSNTKELFVHDASLMIPKEALRPFQETPSVCETYTGRRETEKFNPDAPVTLLRRTAGDADSGIDTNSGIIIWLRPEGNTRSEIGKASETVSQSKPVESLDQAVAAFNRKLAALRFNVDRPQFREPALAKDRIPLPLTTEEVVAAIRNWDRKGNPAPDETYALYAGVARTKVQPEGSPGTGLGIFDQWCVDPADEKFEDRVWRIDLSLATGESTGYTFPVRTMKLGRRVALKNTSGYSWIVEPHADAGHAGYMSSMYGYTFSVDNDKQGRIVVTVARAIASPLADLKVVAFEEGGQRHDFAQDRLGGPLSFTSPDPKLVVQRFHLEPGLAGKIRYWGIEVATDTGSKSAGVATETSHAELAAPQLQNPADLFQARWESLRNSAPPENRGRPVKMSPEEIARFARLSEEQQKAAMLEGIKKIQRACGNVSLSTTTCISKIGDPRKSDGNGVTLLSYGEFGTSVYNLRRIGRSYRVEATDWYLSRQHRKPEMDVKNYDAESGVIRILSPVSRADGTEQNHARIEKEPRANVDVGAECGYASYLGGFKSLFDDYYKVLIDRQSALRVRGVDQQTRLVEVGFTYTDERRKETVSGTAWLDLGKDWMLRKMKQEAKGVGTARGREHYELFVAGDSELIDDVWMPTNFAEYVWSRDNNLRKTDDPFSSADDVSRANSMGNLRETIGENIKLGGVKKEDLAVVFPPGTIVDDSITGDRWTVGKEKTSNTSAPALPAAKSADEEFLFRGWNGARDRLVSGVCRAHGHLSRLDDDGVHCEGPIEYYYAFDYRKGRLRFDHAIPVIDRYEDESGKTTAKTFREVGKYYQTPARTAESSNRQPGVIYLRKPGTLAVDQAKPFDVRAIGLMNFADFEQFTKYESCRIDRWPEGLTSLSAVGSGVWCMRYTAAQGVKFALWVNRDTGYAPVRYEARWPDPNVPPIESSEATWTKVGDAWVPKSVKMEQIMGKVHRKLDLVFEWESVNQPISDHLFEVVSMLPPVDPGEDEAAVVQVISFESGKGVLVERLDPQGATLPLPGAARGHGMPQGKPTGNDKAPVLPPNEKTVPNAGKPETGHQQGGLPTPENIKKDPASLLSRAIDQTDANTSKRTDKSATKTSRPKTNENQSSPSSAENPSATKGGLEKQSIMSSLRKQAVRQAEAMRSGQADYRSSDKIWRYGMGEKFKTPPSTISLQGKVYFDRDNLCLDVKGRQEPSTTLLIDAEGHGKRSTADHDDLKSCKILTKKWTAEWDGQGDDIHLWDPPGDFRPDQSDPRLISRAYVSDSERLGAKQVTHQGRECCRLEEVIPGASVRVVQILDPVRDFVLLRRETYYDNASRGTREKLREDYPFQIQTFDYQKVADSGIWVPVKFMEQAFETLPLGENRKPTLDRETTREFINYSFGRPAAKFFTLYHLGLLGAHRLCDDRKGHAEENWYNLPLHGNLADPTFVPDVKGIPPDLAEQWLKDAAGGALKECSWDSPLVQHHGKTESESEWKYTRVSGIYIPQRYHLRKYLESGELELEREFTSVDAKLNEPIAEDRFGWHALGLREGDQILDEIDSATFRYHDGKPIPAAQYVDESVK